MRFDCFSTWGFLAALFITTIVESSSTFECKREGYHADPHDCKVYYRCVDFGNGTALAKYRFACGPGTVFSKARGDICTHPSACERKECSGTNDIDMDNKSEAWKNPGDTPVTQPSAEDPWCTCEGFLADPKDCSKFYRCISYGAGSYKRHEYTCGNGTVWDPNIESCNYAWAAKGVSCKIPTISSPSPRPSPVTEPTVTIVTVKPNSPRPSQGTSVTPVPKPQSGGPQCTCEGFMADHKDCSKFYRCVSYGAGSYKRHEFTCGNGTVWDPKIESCNHAWAAKRIECTIPTVSSPPPRPSHVTESTVTITTAKPGPSRPSQGTSVTPVPKPQSGGPQCTCEGFTADPIDCSRFYRCVRYGAGSYKRHEFTCGNGTVWDPNIESCNHAWAAKRAGCTIPTVSSPSPVTDSTVTIAGTKPSSVKPSQGANNVPTVSSPSPCPSSVKKPPITIPSVKPSSPRPNHGTSKVPLISSPSPRPLPVTESTVTIATAKPRPPRPSQGTSVTPVPKPQSGGPQCTCKGFMADPKDCSKFYQCVSYGAGSYKRHDFICANGTVWDPNIKSCNHAWAAKRIECTIPTVSSPPPRPSHVTESTVTITTAKPGPSRPSQGTSVTPVPKPQSGGPQCTCEGFTADPIDCSRFYRCVSYGAGSYKRHEFTCGNGTVWDPNIESCNHAWAAKRAGCTIPTVSSPSPVTDSTVTIAGTKPSSVKPSQGASSVPTVSSPSPRPSSVKKPPITIPSVKPSSPRPNHGTSKVPLISSLSPRPLPVTEPTVTIATAKPSPPKPSQGTSVTPVPKPQSGGPQCTCEGLMADPKDCSKFYRCVSYGAGSYKRHEFTCGNGTVWDPNIESCNHAWAAKRAGCTIPTVSSPSPVTDSTVTVAGTKPSSVKPSQGASNVPTVSSPSPRPSSVKKPPITIPSVKPSSPRPNHGMSKVPLISSTSPRPLPVTEPTVTIATAKPGPPRPSQGTSVTPVPKPQSGGPQCTCEGLMADPKDCSKFYRCVSYGAGSYKRHEFTCGNGTVWDPNIESCNHAWAAKRAGCTIPTVSSPSPVTDSTVTVAGTKPSSVKPSQGASNVPTVSSPSPRPSSVKKPPITIPSVKPSSPRPNHGMSKVPLISSTSPRPLPVTEPTVTIATAKPGPHRPSQGTSVTPVPKPQSGGPQCTCEGLMADPKDCSKFYRCVSYGAGSYKRHEFTCGNGTVWDPNIESCNHAWAAKRAGCTISTVSSPSPVTDSTVTIAGTKPSSVKPSQGASNVPTVSSPSPRPSSVKKPPITIPSVKPSSPRPNHGMSNVPLISSTSPRPLPVTEPTVTIATAKPGPPKPSQGTSVTPVPKPQSGGPQCTCEGFMADPKDCSKFYRCVSYGAGSYKRHEFTCGNGTVWDPNIESCNHAWAAKRAGCTIPTVSSPSPVTDSTVTVAGTKPSSVKPSQGASNVPTVSSPSPRPSSVKKPPITIPSVKPSSPRPNHGMSKVPLISSTSPRPLPVTEPTVTIATAKPGPHRPSQGTSVTPVPKPQSGGPQCTCEGLMADPKDCSKFYRCVSYGAGSYKRHEFTCGNGTVWDPNIESCNHAWAAKRAGCTISTVSSPSPVTDSTVTIAGTKPSSVKPSQGASNVPTVSSPSPRPSSVKKPPITIPSVKPSSPRPNHGMSKVPLISSTSPRPLPVTEPTVTIATAKPGPHRPSQGTSVIPVPKPQSGGPQCTCEGFMADPKDCSKFYRCVSYGAGSYKRHEFTCGNGTVWDPNIESCNHAWAAKRIECTIPTVSSPPPRPSHVTEPTVTITTAKPGPSRPSQGTSVTPVPRPQSGGPQCTCEGFTADPIDCSRFYRCVSYGAGSYKRHEFTCGNGTVWDPNIESCNHAWAAKRAGCTIPTDSSPSPVTDSTVTIAGTKPSSVKPIQGTSNVPTVSSPSPWPSTVTKRPVTNPSVKPSSPRPSHGTSKIPLESSPSPRPSPVTKPAVTIATAKPGLPRPSQGTSITSVPKPQSGGPQCTCEGLMADPKDCSKFYRCVSYGAGSYKRHEFTCGNGTVWDPNIESCNHAWAAKRAGCTIPTVSSPSPVTDSTVTVAGTKPSSVKPSQGASNVPTVSSPSPRPSSVKKPPITIPSVKPSSPRPNHGMSKVPLISSTSPRPLPVTEPTVTIATAKPGPPRPSQGTSVTPVPKPQSGGPQCTCEGFMADPKDCSKFYRCVNYGAGSYKRHEFTCGNGTVWDPNIESCNHAWAAKRAGCTIPTVSSPSPVTDSTVTIGGTKPSSVKPSQGASNVPTVSSPSPRPSSVKKPPITIPNVKPSSPRPNHGTSKVPLVSSPSLRPSPVTEPTVTIATAKPSPLRPSQGTSVTPVPKPQSGGPQCTCEGFVADPKDCSKFYRCVSYEAGSYKRHEFTCGNGTVWDPNIKSCNHAWAAKRVGCTIPTISSPPPRSSHVTEPTATIATAKPGPPRPSQGTSVTPVPKQQSGGPQCTCEGFMADSKDCSKFYRCVSYGASSYQRHEFTCGNGTVWDPNIKSCNHAWAAKRVGCTIPIVSSPSPVADSTVTIAGTKSSSVKPIQGTSNVPAVSSPSPRPSTVTKPPITIPSVKPSSPSPSHGTSKIPLVSSPSPRPSPVTKPAVTIATAKPGSPRPSQGTSITSVPKPQSGGPQCTCEGFLADPKDCSKFYRCVSYGAGSFKRQEFTCRNGTVWDPSMKSCNHAWAAKRVGCKIPTVWSPSPRPSPATEPTVTIATVKPSFPRPCQRTRVTPVPKPQSGGPQCTCEGFMADPKDCGKFYRCVSYGAGSYKRYEFTCGNGTVWDPNIKSCNHAWAAKRAGCKVGGPLTS